MSDSSGDRCSLTAHHGTNKEAKAEILASQHFYESSTDSEWAGTGVYFFIDYTSSNVSKNNAIRWATNIKKIPSREVAIIEANIECDNDEIFNVRLDEAKSIFHRYRAETLRIVSNKLDSYNAKLPPGAPKKKLDSTFSNTKKFDCYVFNELCKKFSIKAVIRDAYINFDFSKYSFHAIGSDIPNCIILCVKDESIIKGLK